MNIKQIIPSVPDVLKEGLITLGGVLIAAYIISKFPAVQNFVTANAVTVKDGDGKVLF